MFRTILLSVLIILWYGNAAYADTDHPIRDPATGFMVATRMNPPAPPPVVPILWSTDSSNGACTGMLNAINYWNPGWDVNHMSRIAYRESRCLPGASNSCCSGIFQVHRTWIDNVAMCGVTSRNDLYDPWKNVCAASVIFRTQGMSAWAQTR
jgi:hypothetical protein